MKPYALSIFASGALALVVSFPSPSQAQLSSSKRLPPPPVLKVPQGLPPTIYNPTDAHPSLPVPPNGVSSPIQTQSKVIREYVFTSGSVTAPISNPKMPQTKRAVAPAVQPKGNRTAIKPTTEPISNQTNIKTLIPSIKPNISDNSDTSAIATATKLYQVQVKETQNISLAQVQAVEPMAFVRQTDGFIHAGTFSEKSQAEERVQALATQGVKAEVIAVAHSGTNSDNMANLRFSRQ
ncbi:MAG: hypothetical protein ACKO4S_06130 [Snowella sp.]